jgi:hypothetical protein
MTLQGWIKVHGINATCIAIGLLVSLGVYGAIPFLMMPTVGQALWTTSFAQSISDQSLLAVTANNFGWPLPAPISFGLAAAYPEAILIHAGIAPADAYTLTFATWLCIAFAGCYGVARRFGVASRESALLATTWLTLPLVWGHAGYSMASLGIALLPAYLYPVIGLLDIGRGTPLGLLKGLALYFVAAIAAAFMDGYTFVMFASGAMALTGYHWLSCPAQRSRIFRIILPIEFLGLAIAYKLYVVYVGQSGFWSPPMEAFRGWGLDVSFLLIPSKEISWIADSLGLSQERSIHTWYGDPSVWNTTFLLPLLLLAIPAWVKPWRNNKLAYAALFIAFFGVYLSLGPSFKAWSVKSSPSEVTAGDTHFMPATSARFRTGSAKLFAYAPGLKNMRATYRWLAFGAFGCWLAIVLLHAAPASPARRRWLTGATFVVLLLNLPPPGSHLENSRSYRSMFFRIDHDVLTEFGSQIKHGELVAFLPFSNDFLPAYIAARLGARTYNVGGDKNLAMAMAQWPKAMQEVQPATLPADSPQRMLKLLLDGDADVIVIPNFHEPFASHFWPCIADVPEKFSRNLIGSFDEEWPCPADLATTQAPVIANIAASPYLTASTQRYFSTVRLRPEFATVAGRERLYGHLLNARFTYPIDVSTIRSEIGLLLPTGWHDKEADHVWSMRKSQMNLPVPEKCAASSCQVEVRFSVYGATDRHAVDVHIRTQDGGPGWHTDIRIQGNESNIVRIPLPDNVPVRRLLIDVDGATSPAQQSAGTDERILGIALSSINLIDVPKPPGPDKDS